MSRADHPIVIWKHYAYGYEARLSPYGRAFALARIVRNVPGIHYELVWLYGPSRWRPFQVFNLMIIERMVDRWVACHRDSLVDRMPPEPTRSSFPFPWNEPSPAAPDPNAVRTCPGCGRRWGMCDRTLPRAARKRGALGWLCYRMAG
ncbi:hypothetical protein ACQKIE_18795 [Luteibacter sp. NPDC031894]|uniref:hypothetical protein n=1 Tax=Luteibacter sp. NPDC031894 TaxID=3390572 RepID=UPI003CFF70C5